MNIHMKLGTEKPCVLTCGCGQDGTKVGRRLSWLLKPRRWGTGGWCGQVQSQGGHGGRGGKERLPQRCQRPPQGLYSARYREPSIIYYCPWEGSACVHPSVFIFPRSHLLAHVGQKVR